MAFSLHPFFLSFAGATYALYYYAQREIRAKRHAEEQLELVGAGK
jgi:hypothetical protein